VNSGFTDSAIRSPSAVSVGWVYRRGSVSRSAVGLEFFFVGLGSVSTSVLDPSVVLGSMVVGGVCWICHRASQLGSIGTVVVTIAVVGLTRSKSVSEGSSSRIVTFTVSGTVAAGTRLSSLRRSLDRNHPFASFNGRRTFWSFYSKTTLKIKV